MDKIDYSRWDTKVDYTAGNCMYRAGKLPLVRRTDRHEDGSESEYYYFELTEEQYREVLELKNG